MKKIGILYICTGKYSIFWKDFYLSMEKNFLKNNRINYYVFTDSKDIYDSDVNERIHVIYQQQLPWPLATLLRFHIFNKHKELYKDEDYLFFMNANLKVVSEISDDFLPINEDLLFVQHPGYCRVNKNKFPYERNKKSTAYIPKFKGKYYVQGALIGGKTNSFLEMSKELEKNIDIDLKNNVIAKWHDESQVNKYILNRDDYKILDFSYLYPEGGYEWLPSNEGKIIIRDKNNYGGHNDLRGMNNE